MMKLSFCLLVALQVCASPLLAEAVSQELEFPSPSSFDASSIPRNPFKHLAQKKSPSTGAPKPVELLVVKAAEGQAEESLASLFRISSISINRLAIAIVNKRPFAEGDSFKVQKADGKLLKVQVAKIGDGKVHFNCDGKEVVVGLQRKEPKADVTLRAGEVNNSKPL